MSRFTVVAIGVKGKAVGDFVAVVGEIDVPLLLVADGGAGVVFVVYPDPDVEDLVALFVGPGFNGSGFEAVVPPGVGAGWDEDLFGGLWKRVGWGLGGWLGYGCGGLLSRDGFWGIGRWDLLCTGAQGEGCGEEEG
ncbi:hypothetical protein SAMN03080599_02760 [Acidaminobacter hydrogenoformans DSM 2784]|uniref:Uncharacterized protein n=1 Tax=Acidaminobacter hydrogenoformans DSM 2784 TaxID=1120920 RepID=A0A1G5S5C5_9FIRM|nr:hypothetical protein SAMN03080599_02760 [Acidaminobacter hydrogenoformans DSM 2784]